MRRWLLIILVLFSLCFGAESSIACFSNSECGWVCAGDPSCSAACAGVTKGPGPCHLDEDGNTVCPEIWIEGSCSSSNESNMCTAWKAWGSCDANHCQKRECADYAQEYESGIELYELRSCGEGTCGGIEGGTVGTCFCNYSVENNYDPHDTCPVSGSSGILLRQYSGHYKCTSMEGGTCTGGYYPPIGAQRKCTIDGTSVFYTDRNVCYGVPEAVGSCGEGWYEEVQNDTLFNQPAAFFYAPIEGDYDFYIDGSVNGRTMFSIDLDDADKLAPTNCGMTADHYIGIGGCTDNSTRPCYLTRSFISNTDTCGQPCPGCTEDGGTNCAISDTNAFYKNGNGDWVPNFNQARPWWDQNFNKDGDNNLNKECVLASGEAYRRNILWSTRHLKAGHHRIFYKGGGNLKFRYPAGSSQRAPFGDRFINFGEAYGDCPLTPCDCTPTTPNVPAQIEPTHGKIVDNSVGTSLSWGAIADWGQECSGTGVREYEICLGTSSGNCNILTGIKTAATSYITSVLNPGTYYWKIRSKNKSSLLSDWSTERVFSVNSNTIIPTDPPEIHGITVEGGLKNQICDPQFGGSRIITVNVKATDNNGGNDITVIRLRFNGIVYSSPSSCTVSGNDKTCAFVIDVGSGNYTSNFEVYAADAYVNTDWVDTGRSLKVWDCLVPVSGSVYDSSTDGGSACGPPPIGFTNKMGAEGGFTGLTFAGVGTPDVATTISGSADYSGNSSLVWGKRYNLNFTIANAPDPSGSSYLFTDVNKGGSQSCGTGIPIIIDSLRVDPYQANPRLQIAFATIKDQDPWYQVRAGGIRSGGSISTAVPPTCYHAGIAACIPAVSVGTSTVDNSDNQNSGLVSAVAVNNVAGCGSLCEYGWPNDYYAAESGLVKDSNYNEILNKWGDKTGLKVYSTSPGWAQILSDVGGTGIVFVNSDLNIDQDNTLAAGRYLVIMAGGDITISQNVANVAGILASQKSVTAGGESTLPLTIRGSVYAKLNIRFNRSYINHIENNIKPSVRVIFNPELGFVIPQKILKVLTSWRADF